MPPNEVNGGSGGGGTGTRLDTQEKVQYKYKGGQTINNQKADLYEVKTVIKFNIRNTDMTSIVTDRFWFDKDGLLVKTESSSENNGRMISRNVHEYEYDANIRIEAPIKP